MERPCCAAAERARWLEQRLRQLRIGRQVLMELLRRSEERRAQQVRVLEARLRRVYRRLRAAEDELAAARRELARLRARQEGIGAGA